MKFHLSIITPNKVLLQDEVDEVIIPTTSGDVGILANHAPLLSQISSGELLIKKGDKQESMVINGGFLEMSQNNLSILADYAINTKDVDLEKTRKAKERAEKLMKEKISDVDYAELEKEFARALAELNVAKKYRP